MYYKEQQNSMVIRDMTITYTQITEEFEVSSDRAEKDATVFAYSYQNTSDADKHRPVIFAYNGGPGASSEMLHVGLLGPKLVLVSEPSKETGVAEAAKELTPNTEAVLDVADLVMIDPPGTGYTRIEPESKSYYFTVSGDAKCLASMIEQWLDKYDRWDSPVYLLGESYGTIRNVGIAETLSEKVKLKGIINIGTSLNVGAPPLPIEPTVRRMVAYAAVNHYHHPKGKPDLEEFLREAYRFAYDSYVRAIALGSRLGKQEYQEVLEKLHYFTGMSCEYLEANRLKIKEKDYYTGCCEGNAISIYDGRYVMPLEKLDRSNPMEDNYDPFMASTYQGFLNCVEKYMVQINPPKEMHTDMKMYDIAMEWDYDEKGMVDAMKGLEKVMGNRKNIRVMFVAGIYDMQSTVDFIPYFMSQYDIPQEMVMFCKYLSGHMAYFGDALPEVLRDIRTFVTMEN